MPSTHNLHYAIPLCFAPRMVRRGQHGWHFTCYQPLRYDASANLWRCVDCGSSVGGELVAARRWSLARAQGSSNAPETASASEMLTRWTEQT